MRQKRSNNELNAQDETFLRVSMSQNRKKSVVKNMELSSKSHDFSSAELTRIHPHSQEKAGG
jgi:hypothetical protein